MDDFATAAVKISANLHPLKLALDGLGSAMMAPLTAAANTARHLLGGAFEGIDRLWAGDFGGAAQAFGNAIARSMGSGIHTAFSLLGPVGDKIGGALESLVGGVGGAISGTIGKVVSAVTMPISQALSASLLDWNMWVSKSIVAEDHAALFGASIGLAGDKIGYTANELKAMAAEMGRDGQFGAGAIRDAMTSLSRFDRVRGEVFRDTIDAGLGVAEVFNTDLTSAVQALGFALQDPEKGLQLLQRQMRGLFTEGEVERIKAMNDPLEQQAAILDQVNRKIGFVAEAKGNTVSDRLSALSRAWNSIGMGVGEIFLPFTGAATDLARGFIDAFGGVKPVLADIAAGARAVGETIRGWIAESAGDFKTWAGMVQQIASNLWGVLRTGFGMVFGEVFSADNAKSFWDAFKEGVTGALSWLSAITSSWDNFAMAGQLAWEIVKSKATDFIEPLLTGLKRTAEDFWEYLKAGINDFVLTIRRGMLLMMSDALGEMAKMHIPGAMDARDRLDEKAGRLVDERERGRIAARNAQEGREWDRFAGDLRQKFEKAGMPGMNVWEMQRFAGPLPDEQAMAIRDMQEHLAGVAGGQVAAAQAAMMAKLDVMGIVPRPQALDALDRKEKKEKDDKFEKVGLADLHDKIQQALKPNKTEKIQEDQLKVQDKQLKQLEEMFDQGRKLIEAVNNVDARARIW